MGFMLQPSCSLLDRLPREIRDRIYEYVLIYDTHRLMRLIHVSEDDIFPHGEKYNRARKEVNSEPPQILRMRRFEKIFRGGSEDITREVLHSDTTVRVDLLRANKQIYAEASETFFGKNRFLLHMENIRPYGRFRKSLIREPHLSLMKDLKLELPWKGFETYRSSDFYNGNVTAIKVLVEAWRGRTGIKNLEVEIRPSGNDYSGPQFAATFESTMDLFQRVQNVKSVAMSFNLDAITPVLSVYDQFPAVVQPLQDLKNEIRNEWKNEIDFLMHLVLRMKAQAVE